MKTFTFILAASLATPASAFSATSAIGGSTGGGGTSRLSMLAAEESATVITPNPVIKLAANGMSLLKPIFALEANLQAVVLGALADVNREAVASDIEARKNDNDVLIYTYGLSPFSTEALSILDATGCEYEKVELGLEWFLLGGVGSETRVALSRMVEGGATSLPKVFIRGECIGGCAELASLAESGELVERISRAKSAKRGAGKGISGNFLSKMFM
jgi:glutaredoxin-related protein